MYTRRQFLGAIGMPAAAATAAAVLDPLGIRRAVEALACLRGRLLVADPFAVGQGRMIR